ncbi:MAG TPA: hypothetical protein VF874_10065 [Mycobacterium sp.]
MCRAVVDGGRRCPCTRGDRRRAYQRMRYAARQAAAAAPPASDEHTVAATADPDTTALSALEQRRTVTAATVNEALTVLRDPDRSCDPDVHEAYLDAVLEHGAVVRDIADHKIDQAYAERGLNDASVNAEAAAIAPELERIESEWREAKTRTDDYLTAAGDRSSATRPPPRSMPPATPTSPPNRTSTARPPSGATRSTSNGARSRGTCTTRNWPGNAASALPRSSRPTPPR